MITIGLAIVLAAAMYVGLTYCQRNRAAFLTGVTVTLALWVAPFAFEPSYASALYILLGVIGSAVFGLTGVLAWRRSRNVDGAPHWSWLVGSAVAVAPAALLAVYQLFR